MRREWTLEEHRRMMQLYERMPNNWRLISVVGVRRGSEGQTMDSGGRGDSLQLRVADDESTVRCCKSFLLFGVFVCEVMR